MRPAGITLAILLSTAAGSCASNARVDCADARVASNEHAYSLSEADTVQMRALAVEISSRAEAARRDWLEAKTELERASTANINASGSYARASEDYQIAAQRFRTATTILILAAASDLFLRGVCGPKVSTGAYRRQLRAHGVDLDGKDIDHIFAKSRGGPDRPWNYNPLASSINRSIGAGGLGWKLANFPLDTLNALAKTASYYLIC